MDIRTGPGTATDSGNTASSRRRGFAARLAGRAGVVLALLTLALVAACGGGGSSGDAPESQPEATAIPAVVATAAAEPEATATPADVATAPGSEPEAAATPTAEKTGPNFEFILYQGAEELGSGDLDLHQLQGKPLVLNFWAGLCPPCRAEMPDFQEFYDEYGDRVTLLGIDLGRFTQLGSIEDAKALLEELDITYPAGYTDDNTVIREFKVLGMPTTVFLNADGSISSVWGGVLTADTLRERADQLLAQ